MPVSLSPLQDGVTPVDEMPGALTPTEIKREIQHHPEHPAVRHCLKMSGLMKVPVVQIVGLSQRLLAGLGAEDRAMVEAGHVPGSAVADETIRIQVQQLPSSERRHLRKQKSLLLQRVIAHHPLAVGQAVHRLRR